MLDPVTLLIALALLGIVTLLHFVGCGELIGTPAGPDPDPNPPATTTNPPGGPGPGPIVILPPLPLPEATILELQVVSDINASPLAPAPDKVESVLVTWTLSATAGGPVNQPLRATIVRANQAAPFLAPGPGGDPPVTRVVTDDQLNRYDQVACECTVATRPAAGPGGPFVSKVTAIPVPLLKGRRHFFQLVPDPAANPTDRPRPFKLSAGLTASGATPLPPTRLQLNPSTSPHINTIVPGGTPYRVSEVRGSWELRKTAGGPVNQILDEAIVRADASRRFLSFDEGEDAPAMWDLSAAQLQLYDAYRCRGVVTTRPIDPNDPAPDGISTTPYTAWLPIQPGTNHVLTLLPDWIPPDTQPRQFFVG